MERKEAMLKAGCSSILWIVLAVVLCAAPILRADVTVPAGETWDINYDVQGEDPTGTLLALGTANVLPNAVITDGLLIGPEGTANIYGGAIASYIMVDAYPVVDIPLTVYGTDFTIGGIPKDYGVQSLPGMGELAGKYGDGSPFSILIYANSVNLQPPPGDVIKVTIDIKPGSDPNPINPGSNGVIPVAILTTDTFNAADVDPETVTLNGANVAVRGKSDKLMARLEDIDGDGDEDLMLQVDTQSWAELWEGGDVILTGYTYEALGGEEIQGIDSVIIVPPE